MSALRYAPNAPIVIAALQDALGRDYAEHPCRTISEVMALLERDMHACGIANPLVDRPELGRVWCDLCSLAGETPPTRVLRAVEAVRKAP